MKKKDIKIDSLVTENLQIRVAMNEECIEDYAAGYRETPEKMPPVVVYYDAMLDKHYLADGFHRVAAVKVNGGDTITAEVREGTFDDALREALKANATNGLRRTNADKIHAMEVLVAEWDKIYKDEKRTTSDGLPSKRQLMDKCCVTDYMATNFIKLYRVVESTTPCKSAITGKATNCYDGKAETASALKTTKQHFEERNPKVSALLKQHKDRFGMAIPDALFDVFDSREIIRALRDLGTVRTFLEEKRDNRAREFVHCIDFALRHLDAVIRDLREGEPYCVCRACRGIASGKMCGTCGDTGFMTKRQYDMLPPDFKAQKQ